MKKLFSRLDEIVKALVAIRDELEVFNARSRLDVSSVQSRVLDAISSGKHSEAQIWFYAVPTVSIFVVRDVLEVLVDDGVLERRLWKGIRTYYLKE